MNKLQSFLQRIVAQESLSQAEAQEAMQILMAGEASAAQIGAFLTALRMKGEHAEEIIGCATAMLAKAQRIQPTANVLLDTCGTGGDGSNTFNISTATALVAAGAGITVVKHGNRAVSSKSGSADVLEALGVSINLPPPAVEECINHVGVGFLFAPLFHKAAKNVAAPRREIGIRTIFNILGPLVNPAGATHQLLGVYDAALTKTVAEVLRARGLRRALVVHGDGLDELSTCGKSSVTELDNGQLRSYRVQPEECGLSPATPAAIAGGSPEKNAAIIRAILNGEQGAARDIVVLNAGAALYLCGTTDTIAAGVAQAAQVIDSGAAQQKLKQLVEVTRALSSQK